MIEQMLALLEAAAGVVAALGVLVILFGVGRAAVGWVRLEFRGDAGDALANRALLRRDLGFYLLFGLQILVAADVIDTLLAPTGQQLLVLGAIVVIRTLIGYSLNLELREAG